MRKFVVLTFLALSNAILLRAVPVPADEEDNPIRLDSNGKPYQNYQKMTRRYEKKHYYLWWSAYGMEKNDTVEFYNEVENSGFVGFGFADLKWSSMRDADLAIMWRQIGTDEPKIHDYHGLGNYRPVKDAIQNWEILETGLLQNPRRQFFRFRRLIDTLDAENDQTITRDERYILFSFSEHRPQDEDDIVYHQFRDKRRMRLLHYY